MFQSQSCDSGRDSVFPRRICNSGRDSVFQSRSCDIGRVSVFQNRSCDIGDNVLLSQSCDLDPSVAIRSSESTNNNKNGDTKRFAGSHKLCLRPPQQNSPPLTATHATDSSLTSTNKPPLPNLLQGKAAAHTTPIYDQPTPIQPTEIN